MTYRSLTIEKHGSRSDAEATYRHGNERTLFGSLNPDTWPVPAVGFAQARGVPIDYVDNCWSRIAVDGAGLREFLQLGCGVDPEAPALLKAVDDDAWYVIQDEEF